MSGQFDRIREYIREYDGDDFVSIEAGHAAAAADLARISEAFSFPLPAIFREYLSAFGTLDIGGIEFGGVSGSSYLNVIDIRNELVEDHGYPDDLIPLANEEGDSYVCIRADGALVRWHVDGSHVDVLEESLGNYLLRLCNELIEDEEGDDD